MKSTQIDAVSICYALKKILSGQPYSGIIKGVYKQTVNIGFEHFFVTVTDVEQKNLPYGIICQLNGIDLLAILCRNDIAEIDSDSLRFKNEQFEISLQSAAIWNPEFMMQIQADYVPIVQQNIDRILQFINRKKISDGLVPLFRFISNLINVDSNDIEYPSALVKKAYTSLKLINKSIRNFDDDLLIKASIQMTGLGIGLTPSGDDVLAGLFATLIITTRSNFRNWLINILERLLPQIEGLTNDISINYLDSIKKGYFPERFSSLIAAIITAESDSDLQPALQAMLRWGQTSGYEIVLGMIIGCLLTIEDLEGSFEKSP